MGSDGMRCPIVLACDKRYAMPLATTLRSIVDTNRSGGPLEFHVLVDDVSKQAHADEDTRLSSAWFCIDPMDRSGLGYIPGFLDD